MLRANAMHSEWSLIMHRNNRLHCTHCRCKKIELISLLTTCPIMGTHQKQSNWHNLLQAAGRQCAQHLDNVVLQFAGLRCAIKTVNIATVTFALHQKLGEKIPADVMPTLTFQEFVHQVRVFAIYVAFCHNRKLHVELVCNVIFGSPNVIRLPWLLPPKLVTWEYNDFEPLRAKLLMEFNQLFIILFGKTSFACDVRYQYDFVLELLEGKVYTAEILRR